LKGITISADHPPADLVTFAFHTVFQSALLVRSLAVAPSNMPPTGDT